METDEKTFSGLLTDDGQNELTVQQTIDAACALAISIANDNNHGYSQQNRWGPDYDCSSMLISVWQTVGVPVRDAGASYTGNMYQAFASCGFVDVIDQCNLSTCDGLQRGDVLLNHRSHAAMYIGNRQIVHARSSEGNSITGDQSGNEIRTQSYYDYPWDAVLRYVGGSTAPTAREPDVLADSTLYAAVCLLPELRQGDSGYYVRLLQTLLALHGCAPANSLLLGGVYDGEFGQGTAEALNKFKARIKLPTDGVCTPQVFAELIEKEGGGSQ